MTYHLAIEDFERTYPEFEPLYRAHYAEMSDRLKGDGVDCLPYNPRLDQYCRAAKEGWLLHFTARRDGAPVGYCNVFLTNDMHSGESMSREDVLFVVKPHRNGLGKRLVRFGLAELKRRGVKKLYVNPVTDLRVAKIWQRMGFREVSSVMVYQF